MLSGRLRSCYFELGKPMGHDDDPSFIGSKQKLQVDTIQSRINSSKPFPRLIITYLLQLFNDCIFDNTSPQHWKQSKMLLLPKEKSTVLSVTHTRPIFSIIMSRWNLRALFSYIYLVQWINNNGLLRMLNNPAFEQIIQRPFALWNFSKTSAALFCNKRLPCSFTLILAKALDKIRYDE